MSAQKRVRVLVIDDSARNRQAIRQALANAQDLEVAGYAGDGDEGLKLVHMLEPDVITLDLEMPRLDGFAFLRLLRSSAPTPVLVVSSHAHRSDVFKAMELGAYDFVSKADGADSHFEEELLEKVRAVELIRAPMRRHVAETPPPAPFVVGIGASTGGPGAIQRMIEGLAVDPNACLLIVQHMPPGFTTAFAERLDRLGPFAVREAADGDVLGPGKAFIAPGGKQLQVKRNGTQLELETVDPLPGERHAPSVDRLFASMAEVLGSRAVAVVLTGMGNDGATGAWAIAHAGGMVLAESKETAVIFGMPGEAIATGAVKKVLPLHELPGALLALGREAGRGPRGPSRG